jgi:hypothetical protein
MKASFLLVLSLVISSSFVSVSAQETASRRSKSAIKPALTKPALLDITKGNEFPQRKPGLWEIRTTASQAAGLPAAMFCVGDTTDTQLEHLDRTFGEKGACRTGPFRQVGAAWMSESVCREGKNIVSSRSIVSGDLQTEYRIDTETSYALTSSSRREDREAIAARYVNPCPSNMRSGDLLISGMGKLNMVDGAVVPAKAATKKRKSARTS